MPSISQIESQLYIYTRDTDKPWPGMLIEIEVGPQGIRVNTDAHVEAIGSENPRFNMGLPMGLGPDWYLMRNRKPLTP